LPVSLGEGCGLFFLAFPKPPNATPFLVGKKSFELSKKNKEDKESRASRRENFGA